MDVSKVSVGSVLDLGRGLKAKVERVRPLGFYTRVLSAGIGCRVGDELFVPARVIDNPHYAVSVEAAVAA